LVTVVPNDSVIIEAAIGIAKNLIDDRSKLSYSDFHYDVIKKALITYARGGPYLENTKLRQRAGLLAKRIEYSANEEIANELVDSFGNQEEE